MTLFGLVLLAAAALVLTSADAKIIAAHADCDDCNENEPWRPLFKPSQIIHSEFPEHVGHISKEEIPYNSYEQGVQYSSQELPGGGIHGIDSKVKSYSSDGMHRVEWDHFGDVSHVSTAAYQSLEDRDGAAIGTEEDRSTSTIPEGVVGRNSEDGSFFNEGSFFDEKFASSENSFSKDFETPKDSTFSDEVQSSNSVEFMNSHFGFGRPRTPVATSYSAISSIFTGARSVPQQPKHFKNHHSELTFKDISNLIKNKIHRPVSHSRFFDGRNVTKQYLVHESQTEEPRALVIDHVNRSSAYVPLDHPVYRYVKSHGGLMHNYRRWQDARPPTVLQPYVRVQKHRTLVHHIIPTKDPFSDRFWKESKSIENLKPPPLGQTLYLFKQKRKMLDLNKPRRRRGHNYVYIIKSNKRLR